MEKMNLFEMQTIAGGISREEYCAELNAIIGGHWDDFTESEKKAATKSYALLSRNLCNNLNIF